MISKHAILRNLQEISCINNQILRQLSFIAAAIWACLTALSINSGDFLLFCFYGLSTLVSAVFYCLSKWFIPKRLNLVLPLIYTYLCYCLAAAAYLGIFIPPRAVSVTFICLILIAPMVILDLRWRVNTIMVAMSVMFCALSVFYQPPAFAHVDLVNCTAFCIIGLFIGQFMTSIRINNIEMNRKLTKQRDTDILTTLSNRRKLSDTLKTSEDSYGLFSLNAVIMIDIDHFKKYNDDYGHQKGDAVLKELGKSFSSFFKPYGLDIFRYGGEEFIALGQDYGYEELRAICGELLETIQSLQIPFAESPLGIITVSIGFAEAKACQASNYKALIDMADQALYKAKEQGRNRVEGYLGLNQ
ncbi:GGDEF domain-containing protein [Aminipila butyrica]|uniref:GGDEF domain-containing protein n=1 Tax=Aminipila butyrica TaxID=433296 RepID=A0A858BT33_9FIRM|nr:GGDEF domain-containing protein [Aminipila butyrica]QIB68522.1 GGDEF domain-containing protein [Aminipila butyrica]